MLVFEPQNAKAVFLVTESLSEELPGSSENGLQKTARYNPTTKFGRRSFFYYETKERALTWLYD
jgi:hypothetical protein